MGAERLGRIAYEAYCACVGGVSVRGEPLPAWDEQRRDRPQVADAWVKAARAVRSAEAESCE